MNANLSLVLILVILPMVIADRIKCCEDFCRALMGPESVFSKIEDDGNNVIDTKPPPNYEEVPGVGFYRFHEEQKPWEEASRICQQEGSHLAILNSEKEAQGLMKIKARYSSISHRPSYVGLHDSNSEGKFETVFGTPVEQTGYAKWAPGEPNDDNVSVGEDCVTISNDGYFNDVPCYLAYPFFCEHS